MTTFANVNPGPSTDGLKYCSNAVIPAVESGLADSTLQGYDPIPVPYEVAVVATVELSAGANIGSNSTYIVLQTDVGSGQWYDLAWILWTGTGGQANFLLSAGVGGANVITQRTVGTAPAGSGSNQAPLGSRIRFVGKSTITGVASSSSAVSSPGNVPSHVTATIRYKLVGLR
jgi:hypothetical protein